MLQAQPLRPSDNPLSQLDFIILQLTLATKLPRDLYNHLFSGDLKQPSVTLAEIATALSKNRSFIESLPSTATQRSSMPVDMPVSHHIKIPKGDVLRKHIHYLDVVYDPRTKNMTVLIKLGGARNFQGSFKRATSQIALQLNESGSLCISPVVSYKTRVTPGITPNKVLAKSQLEKVMQEVSEQGAVVHTCISGSVNGRFIKSQRHYQRRAVDLNKGLDVADALNTMRSRQQSEAVHNLCHYMVQVGQQLSNFHGKQNLTHGDVKLKNILFRKEQHGAQSIPCYTLIDYPDKSESFEPTSPRNYTNLSRLVRTLGVSTPFVQVGVIPQMEHSLITFGVDQKKAKAFSRWLAYQLNSSTSCGHAIDSYAFLYGFGEMVHKILQATAKPSAELLDCKAFFVEAMGGLLDSICDPNPMPIGYTVYGLRDLFQKRKPLASIMREVKQAITKLSSDTKAKNFDELLAHGGAALTVYTSPQKAHHSDNSSELSTAATELRHMVRQQIVIGFWARVFDFFNYIRGRNTRVASRQKLNAALCTLSSHNSSDSDYQNSLSAASNAILFLLNTGMVKNDDLRSKMCSFLKELQNAPLPPKAVQLPSTNSTDRLQINLDDISSSPFYQGLGNSAHRHPHKRLGPLPPAHSEHKPQPRRRS